MECKIVVVVVVVVAVRMADTPTAGTSNAAQGRRKPVKSVMKMPDVKKKSVKKQPPPATAAATLAACVALQQKNKKDGKHFVPTTPGTTVPPETPASMPSTPLSSNLNPLSPTPSIPETEDAGAYAPRKANDFSEGEEEEAHVSRKQHLTKYSACSVCISMISKLDLLFNDQFV